MSKCKKLLALLLIIAMVLCCAPLSFAEGRPIGEAVSASYIRPQYAKEGKIYAAFTAPCFYSAQGANAEFTTDASVVAALLREGLEARNEGISFRYTVDYAFPADQQEQNNLLGIEMNELLELAVVETDQPTEGDSIRYSYIGWQVGGYIYRNESSTDLELTLYPTYFSNAAQEAELTAAVDALIEEFAFTAQTTERQKADAIYDWICANVEYDYDRLEDDEYLLKYSAYAAMVDRVAVCEGYAVLFYRLAEEVGLDARVITGDGGGPHSWNIVRLGSYYYYLDSTWDAGVPPENYSYYLKGESDFPGHTNDPEFNTVDFRNRYPIAASGLTSFEGVCLTFGDWRMNFDGSFLTVAEYLGKDAHVTVPGSIDLAEYDMGSGIIPVYSVAEGAFNGNDTIETLTIDEGIERLGVGAIVDCPKLQELHLPSTLRMQSYGFSSFTEAPRSCDAMRKVTVASGNPYLKLISGILYSADQSVLLYCPPSNGISGIHLPEGVLTIGNEAFASHKTLKIVSMPDSLIEIGYWAFSGAAALEQAELSEGCLRIGQYAFAACPKLESLRIPAKVEEIRSGTFFGTPLQTIAVDAANQTFRMEGGILIGNGVAYKYALETAAEHCALPEGVAEIDMGAFEGAAFKSVSLPLGLKKIGQLAFASCKNLTHASIPETTEHLDDQVFSGCDMLLSVVIPANVTTFGRSIFHLGLPETYATVFGEEGSAAQAYCNENGIAFRLRSQFPCAQGHNALSKAMDEALSTAYSDVWRWICDDCGCSTRSFTKNYTILNESDLTYALSATEHTYDGERFLPEVLWVRKGNILLTEGVDYRVIYEENRTPFTVNALHIQGIGDYRGDKYIGLTIHRASIEQAVVALDSDTYEYNFDPIQPAVLSVTLNGKALAFGTDYVLAFSDNNAAGIGYVLVRGANLYNGEVKIPFTIAAHQHDWSPWQGDGTQHFRYCTNQRCPDYRQKVYADHRYDHIHDEICNDCSAPRMVEHTFTDTYASDEAYHWRICDICQKPEGLKYSHSPNQPTCQETLQCTVCLRQLEGVGAHSWKLVYDESGHWEDCIYCDATQNSASHFGGLASCTQQASCEGCGQPYGATAEHSWYDTHDEINHFEACYFCRATRNEEAHRGAPPVACGSKAICEKCSASFGEPAGHSGGIATCSSRAFCQYCAQPYGELGDHHWELQQGLSHHWEECEYCENTRNRAEHSGGIASCVAQAICADCGKPYGDYASHQWDNDCDPDCNVCNAPRDAGHSFGPYIYNGDATYTADGTQTRTCSRCGHPETIAAPGTRLVNPFRDVPLGQFYTEPVFWAVKKGITNGTSAIAFSPDDPCTRGQIVTFLWRAAGSPEPQSSYNPFRDVKKGAYYYKAVLWAVEKGITSGTSARTFSPEETCIRAQVVTFLWRAAGKPIPERTVNPFRDVKLGEYYTTPVLWAVENAITSGTSAKAFSPNDPCNRGQIVTFLYRAYNR